MRWLPEEGLQPVSFYMLLEVGEKQLRASLRFVPQQSNHEAVMALCFVPGRGRRPPRSPQARGDLVADRARDNRPYEGS